MGNPTFQFSYLLPKVALPARRKPLHSQLIEFLWISACSLIWDLWGKAQMWEQGRSRLTTHKLSALAFKQSNRCIKDSKKVCFSALVLQGACHQPCYLQTQSVVWTVSPVCFLFDFTVEMCFGRGQTWALKSWILIFRGKRKSRGAQNFFVETNITDSQPQLFYWDDSYIRDRKAEEITSLGSKDQIKSDSCTSVWSHGAKGTVRITHNYFPMWLHSGLSQTNKTLFMLPVSLSFPLSGAGFLYRGFICVLAMKGTSKKVSMHTNIN